MKKILFFFLGFLLLAPSFALAADPFAPMSFYGRADLNGNPLPEGSVVQVLVGGTLVGESTVDALGYYNDSDYAKSRLIVSIYKGDELVFKYISRDGAEASLGDTVVKYQGAFEAGKNVNFDLPFVYNADISIVPSGISVSTSSETKVLGEKVVDYSAFNNLSGLSAGLVEAVSKNEAETINGQNNLIALSAGNNVIYKKIIAAHLSEINDANKRAIAYFIQNGTPTTKRLGAGEQAGALSSFMSAFERAPSSTIDWQDVIKIANGRWPAQTNQAAEDKAALGFKKIYLRAPDMENQNDKAAVTIMAYGLRPAERNTNSEKTAILSFKYIFKKNPTTASDWDMVRAIAYSGAKR